MRSTEHIPQRHLIECVRRRVISPDQLDAILAVVRTIREAEGEARPDFRWAGVVYATAAAVAVAAPAAHAFSRLQSLAPADLLVRGAVAAFVALVAGLLARRSGRHPALAAVLLAGAVGHLSSVGTGAYLLAHGMTRSLNDAVYVRMISEAAEPAVLATTSIERLWFQAYAASDVLVIVAALALGRALRAPALAATGAGALVFLVVNLTSVYGVWVGDATTSAAACIAAGVALVVVGRVVDLAWRGRSDPSFWVQAVGLASIAAGAFVRLARQHPADALAEGGVWTAVALATAALGLAFGRRAYLVFGAVVFVAAPALALARADADGLLVALVVAACASVVAFAAGRVRAHMESQWLAAPLTRDERFVWA